MSGYNSTKFMLPTPTSTLSILSQSPIHSHFTFLQSSWTSSIHPHFLDLITSHLDYWLQAALNCLFPSHIPDPSNPFFTLQLKGFFLIMLGIYFKFFLGFHFYHQTESKFIFIVIQGLFWLHSTLMSFYFLPTLSPTPQPCEVYILHQHCWKNHLQFSWHIVLATYLCAYCSLERKSFPSHLFAKPAHPSRPSLKVTLSVKACFTSPHIPLLIPSFWVPSWSIVLHIFLTIM
jgi:hypothetical protein